MNVGWPENASGQRWESELYASEWMVRQIVGQNDEGDGVEAGDIERELEQRLEKIVGLQNGGQHFYFTLGADVTLREWLAIEAATDRLDRVSKGSGERYRLSDFMRKLLRYREREGGLDRLIAETTGAEGPYLSGDRAQI